MTPSSPTREKVTAALQIVMAVGDCIRDLGHPVPSGELYANMCGHLSLSEYEGILGILTGAGLIKVEHFLITWTGPTKGVK